MTGEVDVCYKLRCESGIPFAFYRSIDDALDISICYDGKKSLCMHGEGELWPRNAYVRVVPPMMLYNRKLFLQAMVRGNEVSTKENGELCIELAIYLRKKGRASTDVFDPPDALSTLNIPNGTYGWKKLSSSLHLPDDTSVLLLRIGATAFKGKVWISTPKLGLKDGDSIVPPFEMEKRNLREPIWLGENLSLKEWPEFIIALDNKIIFDGAVFNAIHRHPEFEIALPSMTSGKHSIDVSYTSSYKSALAYIISAIEILEESARSIEIIHYPEYVEENTQFPVVLEKNTKSHSKTEIARINSGPARDHPLYHLSISGRKYPISINRVVRRKKNPILLSTGDSIYIPQKSYDLTRYLHWYLENRLGNAIGFRSAYRWSGTRLVNVECWKKIVAAINKLGLRYFLMVDGRELQGKNLNPTDAILKSVNYLGRQAHEHDGAFCYWGDKRDDDLYLDILHRSIDPGGVFPAVRPLKREKNEANSFFDSTKANNRAEASRYFIENLIKYKGDSTRHTGPTTLFRYFYQAGYSWLGAELMYGPLDIVLSSLRGASRAYGSTSYGAHIAIQWSSYPHNIKEHFDRLFLALGSCYLHGVDHINVEEGMWRIESDYASHDRFSRACSSYRKMQSEFYRYLQCHDRQGKLRIPIGVIQGRNCGWECYGREYIWGSKNIDLRFSKAEESFDLMKIYFPRSILSSIYRNPCANDKPQGWFSGTPFGLVDLMPIQASASILSSYRSLIFLGWNSYNKNDFLQIEKFVSNGGTLILSKPHISMSKGHSEAAKIPNCSILKKLLGNKYESHKGRIVHKCGKGKVVYFGDYYFPADKEIRCLYEKELIKIGKATAERERIRGWISGNKDISFAVYDSDENGLRTINLLNINWWGNGNSDPIKFLFGEADYEIAVKYMKIETIIVSENYAFMPVEDDVDIYCVEESPSYIDIYLQSDNGAHLRVFAKDIDHECVPIKVKKGGIEKVRLSKLSIS